MPFDQQESTCPHIFATIPSSKPFATPENAQMPVHKNRNQLKTSFGSERLFSRTRESQEAFAMAADIWKPSLSLPCLERLVSKIKYGQRMMAGHLEQSSMYPQAGLPRSPPFADITRAHRTAPAANPPC